MDRPQITAVLRSTSPRANRRPGVRAGCLLGLIFLTGCNGLGKDVDNPVVGPRPPRVSDVGEEAVVRNVPAQSPEIVQVAATSVMANELLREEDIAARVNGTPIFVSEVIDPHRGGLKKIEGRGTPEQIQQLKLEIVRRGLKDHIEQALALDAARKQLKTEQWDTIQTKLDEFFYQKEIPRLMKEQNIKSPQELETRLQQDGMSLTTYRRVWANRQLAGQWVSEQLPEVAVTRPELLEEYRQSIGKLTEPAQIQWQECWIPKQSAPGEPSPQQKLQGAIADLRGGATFDDIVRKYSRGPRDASLGHWDWAQPDSLSDESLKTTLAQLRLNEVGPVIENDRGYRLVKLTGRRDSQVKSFEEVQNKLREAVVERKRHEAAQKLIDDLKSKAHIETMFDGREAPR